MPPTHATVSLPTPHATDEHDLMRLQDDGCPHDGSPWWERCRRTRSCVCTSCLRVCLGMFSTRVLEYLRKNGVEEELRGEALSEVTLQAMAWIDDGTAASMTSARRRGRLCLAALNVAKQVLRRRRRALGRAVPIGPAAADVAARPDEAGPLQAEEDVSRRAARAKEAALFGECYSELSPDQRLVLHLYYRGSCKRSYARIGRLMGYSAATAKRRIEDAVARLGRLFLAR